MSTLNLREAIMQRYSQDKILEVALNQLKEKLIRKDTKLRRKNDDGKKREFLISH